ncbi:MAG: D-tyrosyl-tRNA(Tyr) deacylase [Clostridiaceae bacterium]|jgi:D-tyrosyl-tRNA(Tyr) deacylase|nr:D-tyrosyl-tRNA(Tyr) deacylase [Clostridiaceae bacterium]HZJ91313.1 D-aminoacyl-tRNA deacylase [Oscillospiraceae bacterium]
MRALIQRVSRADVQIDGEIAGEIGPGYVVFLGVGSEDDADSCSKLWNKIRRLRIFADENGKTNLDISQVEGDCLIVSQFTLFADLRRGNRPGFSYSAGPELGKSLYELFVELAKKDIENVSTGEFGAEMKVTLSNEGPFTIWLDTDEF